MSEDATKVTDALRDKIKSKMDVAKFFSGFIILLIGFLLKDVDVITYTASRIGFVLLIASLGFCVAAMLTYDHLLWPKEHFERKVNISDTNFEKHLEKHMLRLWYSLFVPAVGCFGIAFFFLLMQKLDLITLSDDEKGVWMAALVMAFALPILGCVVMWPRMDNKKYAILAILFHAIARPGKRQELIKFLEWDREESMKRERGTLRFDVYQDPKNEDAFYVYEAYENAAAFEKHKAHKPYQRWASDEFQSEVVLSHEDLRPPTP